MQGTKNFMLTYRKSGKLEVARYSDSDLAMCVHSKKSTSNYILARWRRHIMKKLQANDKCLIHDAGGISSMLLGHQACCMADEFHSRI